MTKFTYDTDKDDIIINHEKEMLEKYSKLIDNYTDIFKGYNCSLKVGISWFDFLKGKVSEKRLPLKNGYECQVYCEVQRNGKLVRVISNDEEADWYDLAVSWPVSHISGFFFKNSVNFCTDIDNELEGDMQEFIRLLSDEESGLPDI